MRASISTVPHQKQRYATTGDWVVSTLLDDVNVHVKVSALGDWRYELLVGVHELIEASLCYKYGITDEAVTKFDRDYEAARDAIEREQSTAAVEYYQRTYGCRCPITNTSEPGDDMHAPYYHQHVNATNVEQRLAVWLGVEWDEYEAANLALYKKAKAT
jgi:hypothetical protein